MVNFVGIDSSISSTGVAILQVDAEGRSFSFLTQAIRQKKSYKKVAVAEAKARPMASDHARISGTAKIVGEIVKSSAPDAVMIEGAAYDATGGKIHERAGLWWLLYDSAHGAGCQRILSVRPTSLKKFAGHGSFDKDQMRAALPLQIEEICAEGWSYEGVAVDEVSTDDEIDAMWLAMACAIAHEALPCFPSRRKDLVTVISDF